MSVFPDTVPVTAIWLRSTINDRGYHEVEVLAEIDEEWRLVIPGEPVEHPTISHIVEVGGILRAVDQALSALKEDQSHA